MGPANWGDFFFAATDAKPTIAPAQWLAHLPYILAEMPLPEKTALLLSILRVFDAADVEMAACVADEYEISLKR